MIKVQKVNSLSIFSETCLSYTKNQKRMTWGCHNDRRRDTDSSGNTDSYPVYCGDAGSGKRSPDSHDAFLSLDGGGEGE